MSALMGGCQAVHPHARGEQGQQGNGLLGHFGSSPRTWGTVVLDTDSAVSERFIPTHVGNREVA